MKETYKKRKKNGSDYQGLPGVGVKRGKPRFYPAGVETPADPAGVGVKNITGVFTPPGSGFNFLPGFKPRRGRGRKYSRGNFPAGVGV